MNLSKSDLIELAKTRGCYFNNGEEVVFASSSGMFYLQHPPTMEGEKVFTIQRSDVIQRGRPKTKQDNE